MEIYNAVQLGLFDSVPEKVVVEGNDSDAIAQLSRLYIELMLVKNSLQSLQESYSNGFKHLEHISNLISTIMHQSIDKYCFKKEISNEQPQ